MINHTQIATIGTIMGFKVFCIVLLTGVSIFPNFDMTVQKRWDEKILFSAAYMKKLSKRRHYALIGLNIFPAKNSHYKNYQTSNIYYFRFDSYYGLYTGYYLSLHGLLRPGIHIGAGFRRDKKYCIINGNEIENGYSKFKLSPYYGVGIQTGMFSFIISNQGIGGGVNVQIGMF